MSNIGIVAVDGDASPQNALIMALIEEATKHGGTKVKGINYGMRGLMMEGFQSTKQIVKDISARSTLPADFQSMLQSKRYNVIPVGADKSTIEERAGRLKKTWDSLNLDRLVVIGGLSGITAIREMMNYLPDKYKRRYVVIPKTMNCDVGVHDPSYTGEESPIISAGFATAATVARHSVARILKGCNNAGRIMVAQFLGDYCGWPTAAAQMGGAYPIALPEMFIDRTVEDMHELLGKITMQEHTDNDVVLVTVSEATPIDEEERNLLIQTYDAREKRYTGTRKKNKGDLFRGIIGDKLNEANYPDSKVDKADITFDCRFSYATELDIKIAKLYAAAAIEALFDGRPATMPCLSMDSLEDIDPVGMGSDFTPEDIELASIDHVVLQRVPDRYFKRDDGRPLSVSDQFDDVLTRVSYSAKYQAVEKILREGLPNNG